MGANASRAMSTVSNNIDKNLQNSGAARSTAKCAITYGKTVLDGFERCSLDAANYCNANASTAIDAIAQSAAEAITSSRQEQITRLIPGINVNSTDIELTQQIKEKILQECSADAELTQEIARDDITIRNCKDSSIKDINAGSAQANCGIKLISRTVLGAEAKLDSQQTTGDFSLSNFFGFGQTGSIISVVSCVLLICCVLIVVAVLGYQFIQAGGVETAAAYGVGGPAGAAIVSAKK